MKNKTNSPNHINVTDESSSAQEVRVSRLKKAALVAGISALSLVGCTTPERAEPAPSVSTTAEAAQPSAPEQEVMRDRASEQVRGMAYSITQTFQASPELVTDEAAGDDGSAIQYIQTATGNTSYTLQLQRFDAEMPAVDVNLESVAIAAFDNEGVQTYDFQATLYPDGEIYKMQSTDADVSHAIDFSAVGPVTETGGAAHLNDQDNMLIRANAMLEAAQGK